MKKSNITLIAFLLVLFTLVSVLVLANSIGQQTTEDRTQAATGNENFTCQDLFVSQPLKNYVSGNPGHPATQTWNGEIQFAATGTFGCAVLDGQNPGPWRSVVYDKNGTEVTRAALNGNLYNSAVTQAPTGDNYYQISCLNINTNTKCPMIKVVPASTATSPSPTVTASPTIAPQTTQPPTPTPQATLTPCTPTLSDLNKDCRTTIEDYAFFLESYRKALGF